MEGKTGKEPYEEFEVGTEVELVDSPCPECDLKIGDIGRITGLVENAYRVLFRTGLYECPPNCLRRTDDLYGRFLKAMDVVVEARNKLCMVYRDVEPICCCGECPLLKRLKDGKFTELNMRSLCQTIQMFEIVRDGPKFRKDIEDDIVKRKADKWFGRVEAILNSRKGMYDEIDDGLTDEPLDVKKEE